MELHALTLAARSYALLPPHLQGVFLLVTYFFVSCHTLTRKHKKYGINDEVEPLTIPGEPDYLGSLSTLASSRQQLIPEVCVCAEQYLKRLMQGQLDSSLYGKYRDSFLYEWASGRVDKPVYYFVLIALDLLTKPLLSQRTAALERNLPRCGPQGRPWSRPIVHGCGIFNLVSWNERFPDYPVQRLTP